MFSAEATEALQVNIITSSIQAIFWVGFGILCWFYFRPGKWVKDLLVDVLDGVVGQDRAEDIANKVTDTADDWGEMFADRMVRTHLPQSPVMREAYLRKLYEESIDHIPEAVEFLEEIRKTYKPEGEKIEA